MTFVWPVDGDFVITQPFGCTGYPAEPPLGTCAHFHRGIDLGNGSCGGPIYAAGDGTVRFAGLISVPSAPGGKQSLVTIDHGSGLCSLYIHEAAWLIAAGAHVTAHQKIAVVGKVGAGACHLHYGTKSGVDFGKNVLADSNGTWLDPEGVTLQMYAVDTRVPLAAPNPRVFTAASPVPFYDCSAPNKVVGTLPAGTYHADATDAVSWFQTTTPPVPRGAPFLHVADGPAAGHLVVQAQVTLSPATPAPTPTALTPGLYQVK